MKTKIVVALSAALAIALAVCINSLQKTKKEFAATKAELLLKEETWRKMLLIAGMYKQGVNVTTQSSPDQTSSSVIVRNDDWAPESKYQFSTDGKSVRVLSEGKEVEWTLIPGPSLKQMQ